MALTARIFVVFGGLVFCVAGCWLAYSGVETASFSFEAVGVLLGIAAIALVVSAVRSNARDVLMGRK